MSRATLVHSGTQASTAPSHPTDPDLEVLEVDPAPDLGRAAAQIGAAETGSAFPIVAIGASAGGLEATQALLEHLPANTGAAFVVIQHLDPTHPSHLAELLDRRSSMPVQEVRDGVEVHADHVYVIPPNKEIYIEEGRLRERPRQDRRHMPGVIDAFMTSLARYAGPRSIGIVLSGTLYDGTRGIAEIKAAGGFTLAQELATAKYEDMPRNAIRSGLVDYVLPPDDMGNQLVWLSNRLRHVDTPEEQAEEDTRRTVWDILRQVHKHSGLDFSEYKAGTIRRRIHRRLVATQCDTLDDYRRLVFSDPAEARILADEILIHVTSFFRDPHVFKWISENVLPHLVKDRDPGEAMRIWVPGCATGEEAYGLAILVLEFQRETGTTFPVQIFGTDISGKAIKVARSGLYGSEVLADVEKGLLKRYFHAVNGGYQVAKAVRSLCVFAEHDLLHDPPFSNMDLVSCRNVLIYLEGPAQKRALSALHYALKEEGRLVLGNSESPGRAERLFVALDREAHVYARRPGSRIHFEEFSQKEHRYQAATMVRGAATDQAQRDEPSIRREIDRVMLERFAPASVIVDQDMEVLFFRGDTSPYMKPRPGPADLNLVKMVRPDIAIELRELVEEVQEHGMRRERRLRFAYEGEFREAVVEALPLPGDGGARLVIVAFHPTEDQAQQRPFRRRWAWIGKSAALEQKVQQLEHELVTTREQLDQVVEDYETTVEELRCANEEVLSSNEELQSTNEELQTANEEAHSTAEELRTLNEELMHRSMDLQKANNDLVNLLGNIDFPLMMLGPDLRIRRFTAQAERLLDLEPGDHNRPVREVLGRFRDAPIETQVEAVLETLQVRSLEVEDRSGKSFRLMIHPYKTLDGRIEGAILIFEPHTP